MVDCKILDSVSDLERDLMSLNTCSLMVKDGAVICLSVRSGAMAIQYDSSPNSKPNFENFEEHELLELIREHSNYTSPGEVIRQVAQKMGQEFQIDVDKNTFQTGSENHEFLILKIAPKKDGGARSPNENTELVITQQSIPEAIIDAKSGVILDQNDPFDKTFETAPAESSEPLVSDIGMSDLLLNAALNQRKPYLQNTKLKTKSRNLSLVAASCCYEVDGHTIVKLFCIPTDSKDESSKSEQGHDSQLMPRRVLICDDNQLLAKSLKDVLAIAGIRCEVAINGKEALYALEHRSFDVLMLDLNMPKLNGFDTAKLIRSSEKTYRDIPIIAITGTPFTLEDFEFQFQNFDSFIRKPFHLPDLSKSFMKASLIRNRAKQAGDTYRNEVDSTTESNPEHLLHSSILLAPIAADFKEKIWNKFHQEITHLSREMDTDSNSNPQIKTNWVKEVEKCATSIGAEKLLELCRSYMRENSARTLDSLSSEILFFTQLSFQDIKSISKNRTQLSEKLIA